MSRFRLVGWAGALALSLAAPFAPAVLAAPAPAVPLAEYGKLPDVEFTAISPSGDRIAFVTTINGTRSLITLDNAKPMSSIAIGDMKVRWIRWIGEDRLLFVTSQTEDLGWGFTTDKAEFSVARVLPVVEGLEGGLVFGGIPRYVDAILGSYGIRLIDGEYHGFFGGIELDRRGSTRSRIGYEFDHGRPHLFKVNLENFKVEKIAASAPEGHSRDWVIDASGEVAYTLEVNDESGAWKIQNASGRRIAEGQQARGAVSIIGLGFDGKSLIYVERGEDRSYWWEIGPEGGEPKLFLDDINFERLFWNPETGDLMGYTIGEEESERHIFADKALQDKAERVRTAFATFEASMSDWTADLSHVLVRTSGNDDSGTIYAVDLATNRANAIAFERLAIVPEAVGPISTFKYTAADGLEIDGILTLPPGREAKNLPLVMLPHGGPGAADYPEFDWWAQAFASRGYAVFQPNFRGSTNRDAAFRRMGYGEWGRKMQTDKSDGMKALADAGIIDPARACIVGASYGGYAALAGVTVQQGLYKCAVAVAPVSDIRDMYQEDYRASGRARTTRVALLEQLGEPDLWDDVSPLRRAAQADAPILLIHGRDDTVVPYAHSQRMADKLKDAGKPHDFVTLDGEDHWLSRAETRLAMLEAAVAFVERHNPASE
ncbi:MAG: S9 family peptidase [Erythrobacter sp.]|jgi:dipeptidyl aminopeptidase/acylaminoacyl peptidase|nr:S9 family peptidase [Erythrobacter sp.]